MVEGNLRDEIKNSSPEAHEILEPDPLVHDTDSLKSDTSSPLD